MGLLFFPRRQFKPVFLLLISVVCTVFADDFYYIVNGSEIIEKIKCYGCPEGREPKHECGKKYTKKEKRECRPCKDGYYKELEEGMSSPAMCLPCASCHDLEVTRPCSKKYGIKCSKCKKDHYLDPKTNLCRPCCHCTAYGKKADGCKYTLSKKFCRSDVNGKCKPLPTTSTTTTTNMMTELRTSSVRHFTSTNAVMAYTSTKTKMRTTAGYRSTLRRETPTTKITFSDRLMSGTYKITESQPQSKATKMGKTRSIHGSSESPSQPTSYSTSYSIKLHTNSPNSISPTSATSTSKGENSIGLPIFIAVTVILAFIIIVLLLYIVHLRRENRTNKRRINGETERGKRRINGETERGKRRINGETERGTELDDVEREETGPFQESQASPHKEGDENQNRGENTRPEAPYGHQNSATFSSGPEAPYGHQNSATFSSGPEAPYGHQNSATFSSGAQALSGHQNSATFSSGSKEDDQRLEHREGSKEDGPLLKSKGDVVDYSGVKLRTQAPSGHQNSATFSSGSKEDDQRLEHGEGSKEDEPLLKSKGDVVDIPAVKPKPKKTHPLLTPQKEILKRTNCFVCNKEAKMNIWDVARIMTYFPSIDEHISQDQLKETCLQIYRLITENKNKNPGVNSMTSLMAKLSAEVPDLSVASFLYTFQLLKLKGVAKEIHEHLHG